MSVKKALIILAILYIATGIIFFWYFFIHKKTEKAVEQATKQQTEEIQRFNNLTQEEKVIEAMNNMQRNSEPSKESQQQVLDVFNKMR